jgi:DNA end-binding protein Ku
MAARAYWQGQIRLALVSIPVEIYTATKSGAQIASIRSTSPAASASNMRRSSPASAPVDTDEIVKGYEVEKGEYVLLDQDEIDAVKLESKRTLELTQFVDADEIDVLFYERPISSCPPTIWPRRPSSCCAKRCAGRRRSASASWRCAAANM